MAEIDAKKARKFAQPYCIKDGKSFRLKDTDPADTNGFHDREVAQQLLQQGVEHLAKMQEKLYAQDRRALLLIFQAMDAAGKDGAIKHVMSGINPQGCEVYSFKSPSAEELDHDFLWRTSKRLPERGRIGIFNRSYYEDVLVLKVHPEILAAQPLPAGKVDRDFWQDRYDDINAFERHLVRNGTIILKFFLHVSKGEQKRRFLERLERPDKNWKFSVADLAERQHWHHYQDAYEKALSATSTEWAPWHVIPADHKWMTRMLVAEILESAIKSLDLAYPQPTPDELAALAEAREKLLGE